MRLVKIGKRRIQVPTSWRMARRMMTPRLWGLSLRLMNLRPWPVSVRDRYGKRHLIRSGPEAWWLYTEGPNGRLDAIYGTLHLVVWQRGFGFRPVILYGGQVTGDIRGVYIDEEYAGLPVDGRDVWDLGACSGDSAVYFLSRGAKRVVAFESNEASKDWLQETMAQFPGSTARIGRVRYFDELFYGVDPPINGVMKIDIEGDEHPVFATADRWGFRRAFEFLMIEWHYDKDSILQDLDRLGYGYRTLWGPRTLENGMRYGGIFAWRVGT